MAWLKGLIHGDSRHFKAIELAMENNFSKTLIGLPSVELLNDFGIPSQNFPVTFTVSSVFGAKGGLGGSNLGWFVYDDVTHRNQSYENQLDFSSSDRTSVKVCAYYLPQYHEIAENNLWYGKGFTEWTSVMSAQMMWSGHYQRHIPHSDIGFYTLDSLATLRRQSEDMRKANVDVLVFYHYWFSGRLILEKPSELLLENKDIDIPFFFCWANENWTKKWDGNDDEVLLSQIYSLEDARAFLEHLIPYFKDKRYFNIEGRPVLNIYRPNLIPDISSYISVWEQVSREHGLQKPYLISTRSRGVLDYREYSCDAEVERVLFDWTDGQVDSSLAKLNVYPGFSGRVLDYQEVARYYSHYSNYSSSATTFRSIVPSWDNTARYGEKAYALSDAQPLHFQTWLQNLLQDASDNQSPFVFINAWNEWAEGAHLEADAKFGYAHLNSVGRATTSGTVVPQASQEVKKIYVEIAHQEEWGNSSTWIKAFTCLENSLADLKIEWELVRDDGARIREGLDITLRILSPCLFEASSLEKLIYLSASYPVIGYSSSYSNSTIDEIKRFRETGPIIVYRSQESPPKTSDVVLVDDCRFYPLIATTDSILEETVSTIIEFNSEEEISMLRISILCLATQIGFNPKVIIRCHYLTREMFTELTHLRKWVFDYLGLDFYVAVVSGFDSTLELRDDFLLSIENLPPSRFLNYIQPSYELFPFAYKYLSSRVEDSGRLATFARLFDVEVEKNSRKVLSRSLTRPTPSNEPKKEALTTPHPLVPFIKVHSLESDQLLELMQSRLSILPRIVDHVSGEYIDWVSLGESLPVGEKSDYPS